MFKFIILPFLLVFSWAITGHANPSMAEHHIPDEFFVTQRYLSWTTTFDIETKHYKLGTVHRKLFNWTLRYDFYDIHEQLQAKATKRFFSLGAIFDITDAYDNLIGIVEERFSWFNPTFSIISPTGEILANATLSFWGTEYTIESPLYSNPIATLSRAFFRFKDDWVVKILEPEAFHFCRIDPRLMMVLIAFQTDMDYWRKQQAGALFSRLPGSDGIIR